MVNIQESLRIGVPGITAVEGNDPRGMNTEPTDSSALSFIGYRPVRDKFQYVAIYTIGPMMRGRAVIEYMAEVYAGACATHFHPPHAVRIISMQCHRAFHRFEEAGPSRAAEFCIAEKERFPGNRINKPARPFFIKVGCSKGRLRALLKAIFRCSGDSKWNPNHFQTGYSRRYTRYSGRPRHFFEHDDGRCGEQGFFQCPARGRIACHGGSNRNVRLPLVKYFPAESPAELAISRPRRRPAGAPDSNCRHSRARLKYSWPHPIPLWPPQSGRPLLVPGYFTRSCRARNIRPGSFSGNPDGTGRDVLFQRQDLGGDLAESRIGQGFLIHIEGCQRRAFSPSPLK